MSVRVGSLETSTPCSSFGNVVVVIDSNDKFVSHLEHLQL
jgi:hypothetical protein